MTDQPETGEARAKVYAAAMALAASVQNEAINVAELQRLRNEVNLTVFHLLQQVNPSAFEAR